MKCTRYRPRSSCSLEPTRRSVGRSVYADQNIRVLLAWVPFYMVFLNHIMPLCRFSAFPFCTFSFCSREGHWRRPKKSWTTGPTRSSCSEANAAKTVFDWMLAASNLTGCSESNVITTCTRLCLPWKHYICAEKGLNHVSCSSAQCSQVSQSVSLSDDLHCN